MPVTIVVGGQYGSEGKGKVVALTAALHSEPWVIRCGGPNSGHTTSVHGEERVLRQVPAAADHSGAMLFLAAGCAVDEAVLLAELDVCDISPARIVVDPRAVLIDPADKVEERSIMDEIGSTGSGTGMALLRRMQRRRNVTLVAHSETLRHRVTVAPVAPILHEHIDRGGNLIVEGTQGFALSLLHGPDYPFVTSRDTTAAAFAMEIGISPRDVDEVLLVIRTFPIRVAGNSGPLRNELTWSDVQAVSGSDTAEPEFTSVTRRIRRVGEFDIELVKQACEYNRPTALAVMGIDRLDIRNQQCMSIANLTPAATRFLSSVESNLGVPIRWIGTGFRTFDALRVNQRELTAERNA